MIHSLLIESALRSLLMAAIVWAGMRLFRVRHVVAQKVAWTLVLCAACVLGLPPRLFSAGAREFVLPVYRVLPPIAPFPAAAPIGIAHRAPKASPFAAAGTHATHSKAMPAMSRVVPPPVAGEVPVPWSNARLESPILELLRTTSWAAFASAIYLAICAVLLVRLFVGVVLALRLWKRALPIPVLEPPAIAGDTPVRVSDRISTPVTVGSCILLPTSYHEWPAAKLRVVLAHERSHIRQWDFYLQLVARLYTALFWFSPLGWFVQRKLSDLGEAVSDRAALAEAGNRPCYAEILLEFALTPRLPLVGVGMVRSRNLHRRIDRLLNETHFRLAFLRGRRHAGLAVLLVVIAVVAATAHVRVQAAEAPVADVALLQIPPPETVVAPLPTEGGRATQQTPQQNQKTQPADAYAIVDGQSGTTTVHGPLGNDFEKARQSRQGSYIWFRRDGKSYVIEDPAIVEQGQRLQWSESNFAQSEKELSDAARMLGEQEANLGKLQVQVVIPKIDIPAIRAQLEASLKNLNLDGQPVLSARELSNLSARLAEANQRIAEMQARLSTQHARLGAEASLLCQKQAELAEKQARLAAEQAFRAATASRRLKSLLDQALRDGKAKPAQ